MSGNIMQGNLDVNPEDGYVIVSVNPKIYPLDVVLSSAYAFIEKCYCLVDGNPSDEIIVELRPKDKKADLEVIGREFNNELLNYANYAVQTLRNQKLREAIIDRVLMTNFVEPGTEESTTQCCEAIPSETAPVQEPLPELVKPWEEDDGWSDDPEGIAVPWEEKYGDKNEPDKC